MAIKDSATEQLIIDTAKKIFFSEGRFNATTQDIADAAGVNRTLLNYYFRSRDTLFAYVLRDAKLNMDKRLDAIFLTDMPFKQQIAHFIDVFFDEVKTHPYLDTYIISKLNDPDSDFKNVVPIDFEVVKSKMNEFLINVEREIQKGALVDTNARDFMLNLISLISHPITMQPILKQIFSMDNAQFSDMLAKRKAVILNLLFKD